MAKHGSEKYTIHIYRYRDSSYGMLRWYYEVENEGYGDTFWKKTGYTITKWGAKVEAKRHIRKRKKQGQELVEQYEVRR